MHGRDIHLHLPNGVGRTKLSNAYFDAKLGTIGTLRNWHRLRRGVELSPELRPASSGQSLHFRGNVFGG